MASPSEPTILAFDTSAAHCAAALLSGGRIVAARHEEMTRGQAERLMPLLEEMLTREGMVWQELDAIGVGTGPGNFTGIRISVSAARGLALGLGIPAIGVSGFEALRHLDPAVATGRSLTLLPGPRGQVLWEAVERVEDGSDAVLARGLVDHAALEFHGHVAAPGVIGPWSKGMEVAVRTQLDGGVRVPEAAGGASHPDLAKRIAGAIAEIAARRLARGLDTFPRPAPVYIRPADAAPAADPPPVILP